MESKLRIVTSIPGKPDTYLYPANLNEAVDYLRVMRAKLGSSALVSIYRYDEVGGDWLWWSNEFGDRDNDIINDPAYGTPKPRPEGNGKAL